MAVVRFTSKQDDNREVLTENKYRVLFSFLIMSGARPSEAFGLKWSDVDFDAGQVTIQRTLQWHDRANGGGWFFEDTKTDQQSQIRS